MSWTSEVDIVEVGADDAAMVLQAAHLFDRPPEPGTIAAFLERPGHHLLLAVADGRAVGFVSGIETLHPDKQAEMLLYELGVDASWRRRGVGTALVVALRGLALHRHCRAMWVPTEAGDRIAAAVYRAAGGGEPEPAGIQTWDLTDARASA